MFSDQDKMMTKEIGMHAAEYNCNTVKTERKWDFRSPDEGIEVKK